MSGAVRRLRGSQRPPFLSGGGRGGGSSGARSDAHEVALFLAVSSSNRFNLPVQIPSIYQPSHYTQSTTAGRRAVPRHLTLCLCASLTAQQFLLTGDPKRIPVWKNPRHH